MKEIDESYRKIGDLDDRFDIEFWQSQGDEAIFTAALDLIIDYLVVRGENAHKTRLQRTVESFQRV